MLTNCSFLHRKLMISTNVNAYYYLRRNLIGAYA